MKSLLAWTVLLAFAAACDSADRSATPPEPAAAALMHHLDATHLTVTQPITASDAPQAQFVQVEVLNVHNPSRSAISFKVAYQTPSVNVALGSFALYPPDHPGVFIVATQGKLAPGGFILITMENPDNDSRVRVTLGEIKLISHQTKT